MKPVLFCFALVLALSAAAPFAGQPSIWTVKISTSGNCSKGQAPTGPTNSSILEGNTGLYGCYAADGLDEDYYVTCTATYMTSRVFKGSSQSEPCRGSLTTTKSIPLGTCVDYDWTGKVTGLMYTYSCFGMWCNTTCDTPPCPMDFPCPQETACCLNDPRFEIPCGTVEGCSGDPFKESWFWSLLRKVLFLAIVVCGIMYAVQRGMCNICPWRRPYSTLYGEMA